MERWSKLALGTYIQFLFVHLEFCLWGGAKKFKQAERLRDSSQHNFRII